MIIFIRKGNNLFEESFQSKRLFIRETVITSAMKSVIL